MKTGVPSASKNKNECWPSFFSFVFFASAVSILLQHAHIRVLQIIIIIIVIIVASFVSQTSRPGTLSLMTPPIHPALAAGRTFPMVTSPLTPAWSSAAVMMASRPLRCPVCPTLTPSSFFPINTAAGSVRKSPVSWTNTSLCLCGYGVILTIIQSEFSER